MGSRLEKKSAEVRKRIDEHSFTDEAGEEYGESAFGGFSDYFRRKKIKLQNLDAQTRASSDKPQIFKGVVAHVTGWTQPPLHVLHKELVQHGAGFLQYLDGKTMATHIIASALTPKKAIEFGKYRIVKPAWVVDSIKAGKMLSWTDYRVIDQGVNQKTIQFEGGKMTQSLQPSQTGYRQFTQDSFYTSQFQQPKTDPAQTPRATRLLPDSAASTPSRSTLRPMESIEDNDDHNESVRTSASNQSEALNAVPDQPDELMDLMGGLPDEDAMAAIQMMTGEPVVVQDVKAIDVDSPGGSQNALAPTHAHVSAEKPMTSEEHNALLLADPKMRKSSTANPNFIQQYYAESRLHHLSTWKSELKSRMQKLAAEKGATLKLAKRKPGARRYIMHVDFDSFFCAVSLKKAPEFVDKPAVVAHGNGTGSEIASCNYPAREFGVRNGMWMKKAMELCPNLKILPYDFPAYEETSQLFYESILELGGVVQSVSVDEALVDITSLVLQVAGSDGSGMDEGSMWREQQKANDLAASLRQRIKDRTNCNVSVGIGGSILMAKVALRKAKPAGQHLVQPDEVLDMLGDLKVENLPGVAYSIAGKLEQIGVKLVKDIRTVSKERLAATLGPKTGEKLWEYSRGIDKTEVGEQPVRKSVSAEVNWGIRFINQEEAEEFIMNLCKELERRLLNEGVKGKHLTMKIMRRSSDAPLDPPKHLGHGKCDTFNKSTAFGVATNDAETIGKEAVTILRSFKFSPGDLRGLGVQLQKLEALKTSLGGVDGSQKRLTFGAGTSPAKKKTADPIADSRSPVQLQGVVRADIDDDPIAIDPVTPRKPKGNFVHPAMALARANAADTKARTPLNLAGTQFIMPTNPDTAILAELPNDIRSKLVAQHKKVPKSREASPIIRSRPPSPKPLQGELPADVDPEVFHALPADMQAEILASYRAQARPNAMPQSPHGDRMMPQPAPKRTPTKTRAIRSMFGSTKERQRDAAAGRRQTTFLRQQNRGDDAGPAEGVPDIDPELLAALPEDIRQEVLEDHRRQILASKSGLGLAAPQRRNPAIDGHAVAAPRPPLPKLLFPRQPPRMLFNGSMSTTQDIKDMLSSWHDDTRDEGPHEEDVTVFVEYLGKVVAAERNMDKARVAVRWIEWLVEDAAEDAAMTGDRDKGDTKETLSGSMSIGERQWRDAIVTMKEHIQRAVKERKFAPMEFG